MKVVYAILAIIGVIAIVLVVRNMFPKTIAGPPRIETQYDTVRIIDTAWLTKVRKDTIKVNVVERVTVTVPETVFVIPRKISGILGLSVGRNVGDSTLVYGFRIEKIDSGFETRNWQSQYYTLGPLKSLSLDSIPHLNFYPFEKSCGTACTLKHYATGGAIVLGIFGTLRLLDK
jgi:hypothetical protein